MTDQELEGQLRSWYRAEARSVEAAPSMLRQRVLAIPRTEPLGRGSSGNRPRLMLLLAATLLIGGALAAGAGLLHLPQREQSTEPPPSEEARISPPPSGPLPTPGPEQPPDGRPAETLTRDVLAATQGFRLFPGGAGWAATASGIYRTRDAGETWVDERPAGWTASAASAIVDADTAYLASDSMPMVIAATHVGGDSWTSATIDDPRVGGPPILSFQTPMKGFATFFDKDKETKLRVFATVDGGRTWTGPSTGRIPKIEASMGKVEGPSGGVLYMVSGKYDYKPFNNDFVLSLDGGATWSTRSFPIGAASPKAAQKWIARIWLEADGSIRMAIVADDRGSIWSSPDDGRTWRLVEALPRSVQLTDSDFISPTEWVFALADGSGFRSTTDGGAHWRTTKTTGGVRIDAYAKSFASVDVGWGLEICRNGWGRPADCQDERSVLVSTKDGGRTWAPVGESVPPHSSPTAAPGQATWAPAGSSATRADRARGPGVTAVALADGRVLAAGGQRSGGSAAVYDPADGLWRATGRMVHEGYGQAATPRPLGHVLVIGGSYDDADHSTTERYDPSTGHWSRGPSMHRRRSWFQAIALRDGRVLVVGVEAGGRSSAEIFDPSTGQWTMTGRPRSSRFAASPLVELRDGRVLMAGGDDGNSHRLASAELFDPVTGAWTATADMTAPRDFMMATLLLDGRVLVVGGAHSFAGRPLPTAEAFDPVTGTWSPIAPMSTPRDEASMTLLADGRVLVAGGNSGAFAPLASAEVYDPSTDAWSTTAALGEGRYGHAALALDDGSVLVVGGHAQGSFHYLGSAERYYPNGRPVT